MRRGGDADDTRLPLRGTGGLQPRVEQVLHGEVAQVVERQLRLETVSSQLVVRVEHDARWDRGRGR